MRQVIAILALGLAACGAAPDRPFLQNAPRPDPTAAAGLAAAAAAAATLADPNVNRTPEKKTAEKSNKPVAGGGTVPSDVLDRLDAEPAPEPEPAPEGEVSMPVDPADAPPLPPPVVREP